MSDDLNQKDILLLNNNPHSLVLNHQKLIGSIINNYIRTGYFKREEFFEILQQVNEKLLYISPKMSSQFQGKSLVITYLSSVVRNICNEILRKKTKITFISYHDLELQESNSISNNDLLFEEEMVRLKVAVELFNKQKFKIILCLKLMFKMPFDIEDFRNVNSNVLRSDFDSFVDHVTPYNVSTDKVVYCALTVFFNKYENKDNTPDALRKWVKVKISELLEVLNNTPANSTYSEETLQILFEKCFFSDELIISKMY